MSGIAAIHHVDFNDPLCITVLLIMYLSEIIVRLWFILERAGSTSKFILIKTHEATFLNVLQFAATRRFSCHKHYSYSAWWIWLVSPKLSKTTSVTIFSRYRDLLGPGNAFNKMKHDSVIISCWDILKVCTWVHISACNGPAFKMFKYSGLP